MLIPGLVTGPEGALSLAASLPESLPVGIALLMQAWIADSGGPAGFAASNGLMAAVLS